MEGWDEQEGFFIGLIENGETFEDFDGIQGSELVGFFSTQFLAIEEFFGGAIREALDHKKKIHQSANKSNLKLAFWCISSFASLAYQPVGLQNVPALRPEGGY